MSPGIVASVQCPACGQPFLCQQQNAAGMVSCPHCAHQAVRGAFPTQGHVAAVAQERRRTATPATAAPEVPVHPTAQPYSPEVAAWVAQQMAQPQQTAAPTEPASAFFQPQAETPLQATAPVKTATHTHMHWQTRPDLDTGEVGEGNTVASDGTFVPQHLKPSPWPWVAALAVITALLGGGVWLWMENQKEQNVIKAQKDAPPPLFTELPKKVPTTLPEIAEEKLRTHPPDQSAISADARRLVDELFNQAKTPEQRQACISNGAAHAAQIEALFGPQNPNVPRLSVLAPVKGIAVRIPDIHFDLLFRVTTSTNKDGCLLRLLDDADGQRRIDWQLFYASHEKILRAALRDKPEEPYWTVALLRPNHGFELPVAERSRHLSFQMYISADGDDSLVACIPRETPLGRFMERSTTWGQAYMARVLVRRATFDQTSNIVEIIDCEGATVDTTRAGKSAPAEPETTIKPAQPVPNPPPTPDL